MAYENIHSMQRNYWKRLRAVALSSPDSAEQFVQKLESKLEIETGHKHFWHQKFKKACQRIKVLETSVSCLKMTIKDLKDQIAEDERHIDYLNEIISDLEREVQEKDKNLAHYVTQLYQEKLRFSAALKELKQKYKVHLQEQQKVIEELRAAKNEYAQQLDALYNKNKKLIRLIEMDSSNSGWTSATDWRNPALTQQKKDRRKNHTNNSRRKTGRKPGGQPGHKSHARKQFVPDFTETLPVPQPVVNNPSLYEKIGEKKRRVSDIEVRTVTVEMISEVYRNMKTGEIISTPFPENCPNEQNYGENVKTIAFILNVVCNVSVQKTVQFIKNLTGGQLTLAAGTVSNLVNSFRKLGKKEQDAAFKVLVSGHYLNHDLTTLKVNGKQKYAAISVNPHAVHLALLQGKGRKEIEASGPIGLFGGVGIADHDRSYDKLFREKQECLAHIFRYLQDSIQNEPERKWNRKMENFLKELTRLDRETMTLEEVEEAEKKFKEILEEGKKEYEKKAPEAWFRNGFNTLKRMEEKPEDYLRFLRDKKIPWHNNDAELIARAIKRKLKSAGTFRSDEGASAYLESMALLLSAQRQGEDLFQFVKDVLSSKSKRGK